MSSPRVCLLNNGSMAIDGYKIFWNRGPGGDVRFPVYTTLIEHDDGLFVFDTGFDLEHMNKYIPHDQPIQTADQTVPAQLALAGYRPEDVTHVINSHLHIDHTGGNKYFPNAVFVCHEQEYEAAKDPELFERMSYSCIGFAHQLAGQRPDLPSEIDSGLTPRFELLRGDVELFPGITLFETPGHSGGHYSLMVELQGRRPMIFTGDAAMTPRSVAEVIVGGFHLDPVKATRSLQRLQSLSEEHNAELFCSHHMETFESWVKAPDWYA